MGVVDAGSGDVLIRLNRCHLKEQSSLKNLEKVEADPQGALAPQAQVASPT